MSAPSQIEVGTATREHIKRLLAESEHACWVRHREEKGIATPPELLAVTEHDEDRAEHSLRIFEQLGELGAIRFELLSQPTTTS